MTIPVIRPADRSVFTAILPVVVTLGDIVDSLSTTFKGPIVQDRFMSDAGILATQKYVCELSKVVAFFKRIAPPCTPE